MTTDATTSSPPPAKAGIVIDKRLALVAAAAILGGYLLGQSGFNIENPFAPAKKERPVLKFLMRVAKTGLWVLMCAEEQPQPQERYVYHRHDEQDLVNHREGW